MAGDPRDAYREAMKELNRARAAVSEIRKVISSVSNGLGHHPAAFMAVNFQLTSGRLNPHEMRDAAVNMTQWPDAEKMKTLLTEWHRAFTQARLTFDEMAPEDRAVALPPPTGLSLPS